MSEPLDLDKIEEELKQIGHWPWDAECCYGAIRHVVRNVDHDCYCSKKDEHHLFGKYDGQFIALAPERIAALVKRVRKHDEQCCFDGKPISEVKKILNTVYQYCGSDKDDDFKTFMEILFERLKQLKRGSDEV